MFKLVTRILTALAQRLNSAPPESRTGQLAVRLRSAVKNETLAHGNIADFEDLSQQERMLVDEIRVDAYAEAIARQITSDDVVVDLGAGTGILSFFAARHAKKVYAVEHSGVIDVARAVGDANGFSNVEYVRSSSLDFTPPEKVDVILHEQIGDELFEENMIHNVVDLRTRVLRSGGRILPALFELYAEPVCLLDEYSTPFIWQMNVRGVDYSCLAGREDVRTGPRKWDMRYQHRAEVDHLLCEPAPVYHLDLMTVAADDLPTSFAATKTVTQAGRIDGFFLYFKVMFDDQTEFDTSPDTRTSWGNRLFRVPPRHMEVGDRIDFSIDVPDARHVEGWKLSVSHPDLFLADPAT